MSNPAINRMRTLSLHLSDIQNDVENCQAGLAFLGDVLKACRRMTMDGTSAKGLGHIIHTLNVDLEGTDADFDELRKFFGAGDGERVIDLDQMGGHGQT
ncbi:hypothetical protein K9F62_20835 [Desulfovibrio sp. JY]|nr:hypothetical protein K9F62_20835 [Desulfovibrio sp. JY]